MNSRGGITTSFISAFMVELSKVGRKTRTIFDNSFSERDLTLARVRALMLLSSQPSMNQTDLAAALEIEHPSVVRLLDGMERQGLIVRRPVEGDRRAKSVELTTLAAQQVRELEGLTATIGRRLLRGIDQQHLEVALSVLSQIRNNIDVEPVAKDDPKSFS